MKIQKLHITSLVIVLTIASAIFFNSCNKYDEGPAFSLLSATKRITGTWELKETTVNGDVLDINQMLNIFGEMEMDTISGVEFDLSQITVNSVKMTLEKSGTGNFAVSVSYMGFPFNQNEDIIWSFDDKKENISITVMDDVQDFEIIRLTNKELWLQDVETIDGTITTTIMKSEKLDD